MIHRVHSVSLAEVNRILELIQKDAKAPVTPTVTQGHTSNSSMVVVQQSTATPTTTASGLMIGALVFPEVLLDATGSVLTDENGYALIGVRVESQVITGASDTIQAMA